MLKKCLSFFSLLILLLSLSACGGSSSSTDDAPATDGGATPTEPTDPTDPGSPTPGGDSGAAPKVSAGGNQYADPNVVLSLAGTAEALEGAEIVSTTWTQVSGPTVYLSTPNSLSNMILAPDVTKTQTLSFKLTAKDTKGKESSDIASIVVEPLASFVRVTGSSVDEAAGQATLKLILNRASNEPVTVQYMTQDGAAASGVDYVAASGSVTFEPGETEKAIAIEIIDDEDEEADEPFTVRITATENGVVASAVGTVVIRNGMDTAPELKEQNIAFVSAGPLTGLIGASLTNVIDEESAPGSGAVTYATADESIATVDISSGVVQLKSAGSTVITAVKAADSEYKAAQATYTVVAEKRPGAVTFATPGPYAVAYEDTFTNIATGIGSGEVRYASSNTSVASVTSGGVVTIVGVGSAVITSTQLADDVYLEATATYAIEADRKKLDLSFKDVGPVAGVIGGTYTNTLLGNKGSGALTYSSDNTEVATVNAETGLVSFVGEGNAHISVVRADDDLYKATTTTYSVSVGRKIQSIAFVNPGPVEGVYGETVNNPVAEGAPGSGAVTYSSSNSSVASVNSESGVVQLVGAGSAVITAEKAGDAVYSSAIAKYTLTVNKKAQTLSLRNPGPIETNVGNIVTNGVTVVEGGTGALSYSADAETAIELDRETGEVHAVSVGEAQITVTKAGDANYNAASVSYKVIVGKGVQSIAFTTPGPVESIYGDTYTNVITGGAPGSGAITYASSNESIATINSATGEVTMVGVGSVVITATKAADANYESAEASYTINVAKKTPALTFGSAGPLSLTIGETLTNAATSTSTGAVTYSVGDSAIASVDAESGLVTALGVGSTSIMATQAGDTNHNAASAKYSLNVSKKTQTISFTQPGPLDGVYGGSLTNAIKDGAPGTGAVLYASSNTSVATVNSETAVVQFVGVGTATITATKEADATYEAATASYTITVAKKDQVIAFLDAGPVYAYVEDAVNNPASTVEGGVGVITYSVDNADVAIAAAGDGVFNIVGIGDAVVTATKAGDANHNPVSLEYRISAIETGVGAAAFVGATNTQVQLTYGADSSVSDLSLISSTDAGCDIANYSLCENGAMTLINSDTVTENAALLDRTAYYWLLHGERSGSSATIEPGIGDSGSEGETVRAALPRRYDHQTVEFNGSLWMIGGMAYDGEVTVANAEVWNSTDGVFWTRRAIIESGGMSKHKAVVFDGKLFVYNEGVIWYSSDGVTWQKHSLTPAFGVREAQGFAVFQGALWSIGYASGDDFPSMWRSIDGFEWILQGDIEGVSLRSDYQMAVNNDQLWLVADAVGGRLLQNDVWASTDGVNWTPILAVGEAPFSGRTNHTLFAHDGKLWIIAGQGYEFAVFNDIWTSVDGKTWTSIDAPAVTARFSHQAVVFGGRLWVFGGRSSPTEMVPLGDTWRSEDGSNWRRLVRAKFSFLTEPTPM
ncbi:Ig-like domain-containing protein [Hahella aquimaris]|uniref:Ig-like domain-containing protein n=1 Tax=Hahella sp. HNIBRBA332 TaxID=3015983 RepID=UPI00273C11E2|nr:Ig-like domain-containing protein [Hahella sp. HNIBRBA332]WLQ12973.1 Ig-like domain-containing protein [Hahella sp. HNIBRBA332]